MEVSSSSLQQAEDGNEKKMWNAVKAATKPQVELFNGKSNGKVQPLQNALRQQFKP
jgi:hypothetical protein